MYNGQKAIGSVDLLIEGEVVNTWNYEINPTESEIFNFEWKSIAGIREFEVIAYVSEGEVVIENNNLTTAVSFDSERKTGILPFTSFPTVISAIVIISLVIRRKPN